MSRASRIALFSAFCGGFIGAQCAKTCNADEWITGNMWLESIKGEDDTGKQLAFGYLMGVHDRSETVTSCTPKGVTPGQVVDMVKKSMQEFPETLHVSADRIIGTVLKEHFPCAEDQLSVEEDDPPPTVY